MFLSSASSSLRASVLANFAMLLHQPQPKLEWPAKKRKEIHFSMRAFPWILRGQGEVSLILLTEKNWFEALACCWCNPVSLERTCTKTCSSSAIKWEGKKKKKPTAPNSLNQPSVSFQATSLANSVAQSLLSVWVLPRPPLRSPFLFHSAGWELLSTA